MSHANHDHSPSELSVPLMAGAINDASETSEASLSGLPIAPNNLDSADHDDDDGLSQRSSFDRQFDIDNETDTFIPVTKYQRVKASVLGFYHHHVTPNSGIALLLSSQFFNSIMVTTCKLLVTDQDFDTPIHPLQILFVRMLITFVCCALYMVLTKSVQHAPWGPRELRPLLVLRGVTGFVGVFGLYYSLQYLSLSDAVAITFLIPMVTAFLAWVVLGERYSFLEAGCAVVSLAGVLLIAKPDFIFGTESSNETSVNEAIESSSTHLRLLASAVGLSGVLGASAVYVVLRKIGKQAHPLLSVSYFAATTCVISFVALLVIPSLSFVIPQNGYQWLLFMLIGFSGFLMQFSLTAGVQRVKAGKSSLMIYTNMVFAVFWDLTIWGHLPGLLSILGIIVIIGNAFIVIKYKSNDDAPTPSLTHDLENQNNGDNTDTISLQDFTITDDSEFEHDKEHEPKPKVKRDQPRTEAQV